MGAQISGSGDAVVIVGAGHAGGRAAERLRSYGYDGKIVLIGRERAAPYERPPLSKGVLLNPGAEANALMFAPSWYAQNDVRLLTGMDATGIDLGTRSVRVSNGTDVAFDKLIIATGGRLRRLSVPGSDLGRVHYLRTMEEAITLRDALRETARLVVVGGGFIGLEVAASARTLGVDVTVVEATDRLMGRALPPVIGELFKGIHTERGVRILFNRSVRSIEGTRSVEKVVLEDGQELPADIVVVGVGIRPETELAEQAGLDVDDGILVDGSCRTSDPDVFAIGDAACHTDEETGHRFRLESWQNAETQASRAAASIAGRPPPEKEPIWFWSDQYDTNLQIVGRPPDWDSALTRGAPHDGPFMILRMDGERLLGVIGINAKREMLLMRKLMTSGRPVDAGALINPQRPLKKLVLETLRS